jgi:hypothetical protein
LDEGEETRVDEPGGLGPAVAVVHADERGLRGRQHLRLVLQLLVRLRHGHGVVPQRVRLERHVPHQPVRRAPRPAATAAAPSATERQPPPQPTHMARTPTTRGAWRCLLTLERTSGGVLAVDTGPL